MQIDGKLGRGTLLGVINEIFRSGLPVIKHLYRVTVAINRSDFDGIMSLMTNKIC